MAYAPMQMTPDVAHRERKRAALLRAFAKVGSQGGLTRLLAGIATPSQGLGPIPSFQAGLAGSLNAGAQQQAMEAAAAEQRRQRMMDQQRLDIEQQRADQAAHGEYGAMPWYLRPGVDPALRQQAQADDFYHRAASQQSDPYASTQARLKAEYDFLQGNPQARAMGIGSASAPPQPRQMSPWQAAQVRAWIHAHPGSNEDDAMAGLTYDRPVQTGGEIQARNDYGEPLWTGPDGAVSSIYKPGSSPLMVQTQRTFGSRYGGSVQPQPNHTQSDPFHGMYR